MKQKSLHTSYHAPKLLKFSSTTLIASFCLLKLTPGMALTKASAIGNPNDTGYLGSVFPVSKVVPCLFPENKITQKPCSTYNNSPFLESFQAVLPDLGQVPLLRLRPAVSVQNLEPARQSMQEKVSDFQLSDAQPLTSNEVSQPMVLIPSIPTTQKLSTITSHDAGTVQISSSPNLEPSDFQLAQVLLPAPSNALGHSPVPTATLVKAEVLEVLTEPPKPSDFQLAQVLLPTPS
ncbi:MAG: hypothetical protein QM520_02955, partial [Gammaproteobacteria bacterium]|nr:hypothetical protein [Gammaproteobacteria bacterium]